MLDKAVESDSAKPSGKRTRLNPTARRQQLLAIAVELLLAEPIDQVTVERVAAKAKVSRALVFHYFPSVHELHLAAVGEVTEQLFDEVMASVVEGGDGERRLHRGLTAFVEFVGREPQSIESILGLAANNVEFAALFDQIRRAFVDFILTATGSNPEPGLVLMLRGWVAMVERCVLDWVSNQEIPQRQLVEDLSAVAAALIDEQPGLRPR